MNTAHRVLPLLATLLASSLVVAQETTGLQPFASADTSLKSGVWRYRIEQDATPIVCNNMTIPDCGLLSVSIENQSQETLECKAIVEYEGALLEGRSPFEQSVVVTPKRNEIAVRVAAPLSLPLKQKSVSCAVRPVRKVTKPKKNCAYKMEEAPSLQEFYPPTARRLSETGPVDVEFTLASARGHATDLKVVGSSLSERLDAAGREFVNAVDFSTPCPGTRYTLRVRFQLND